MQARLILEEINKHVADYNARQQSLKDNGTEWDVTSDNSTDSNLSPATSPHSAHFAAHLHTHHRRHSSLSEITFDTYTDGEGNDKWGNSITTTLFRLDESLEEDEDSAPGTAKLPPTATSKRRSLLYHRDRVSVTTPPLPSTPPTSYSFSSSPVAPSCAAGPVLADSLSDEASPTMPLAQEEQQQALDEQDALLQDELELILQQPTPTSMSMAECDDLMAPSDELSFLPPDGISDTRPAIATTNITPPPITPPMPAT